MSRIVAVLLTIGASASAGGAYLAATPQTSLQARAQQRLDQALADRAPQQAQTCLPGPTRMRDQSRTFVTAGDRATVVFGRGGTVYRNDLQNCGGLREGMSLVTTTPTTSLCRGDIIQLVDLRIPNGFGGSCTWGDFVPYVSDKAARHSDRPR